MPKEDINLHTLILDKIKALGDEEASKFFGRSVNELHKWSALTRQPDVHAAQLIFDELMKRGDVTLPPVPETAPPKQGVTIPPRDVMESPAAERKTAVSDEQEQKPVLDKEELLKLAKVSSKYAIICPTERDLAPVVVQSHLSMWKKTMPEELQEHLGKMYLSWDSCIHRSRNELAAEFMQTSAEWSIWIDADMVIPNGNAAWFKRYVATKMADKWMRINALQRLTSHNKSIVSCVYTERSFNGKLICGPGMSPRGPEDTDLVKRIKTDGPSDEVVPVPYVGFGCVAVHRKVFDDILTTFPDLQGDGKNTPDFFTSFPDGPKGEDTAFCARALKAGHQPYIDLAVFAAHIGRCAYPVM